MTAQEVRIGNIVHYFSELADTWLNYHVLTANDILCLDSGDVDKAEPIPLTEDWLKRFGFENWDKNAWQKKNIIGIRKHGEGWLYLSGSLHVNLFYVHQLQNLYFALTQTELTPSDGGKIE